MAGQTVNLAALATYVRLVDLLDIADDRTPFALWKFVLPRDPISKAEWQKHRAISPIAIQKTGDTSIVVVSGVTRDAEIYTKLEDLRTWVESQFKECITFLRQMAAPYHLNLDSGISWNIEAIGFEPVTARFEIDRPGLMELLVEELYEDELHAFLRELLQNSVDAIDSRQSILADRDMTFHGEISISLQTGTGRIEMAWGDNGIGMDVETLRAYFATIGKSWYTSESFRRANAKHDPISRFGVGILSCFAVADSLDIETKRDPTYGGEAPGLAVHIPTRDRHFHIRQAPQLDVGTTIGLTLTEQAMTKLSIESIVAYLREVAGFVRHEVRLSVDGTHISLTARTPEITVRALDERVEHELSKNTRIVTLPIASNTGVYQASYSALFPNDPTAVRYRVGSGYQFSGGAPFEPRNLLHNGDEELFVKGVEAGAPAFAAGDSHWVSPRLLVNLSRPSLVHPTLGRTRTMIKNDAWLVEMWSQIGQYLRQDLLPDSDAPSDVKARAIGSAIFFGWLPPTAVENWLDDQDWPILTLTAEGLTWRTLDQVVVDETVLEAPAEATYNIVELLDDPPGSGCWFAQPAVVHGRSPFDTTRPYEGAAVATAEAALRRNGFEAAAVRLVTSPPSDPIPLVCRVWSKLDGPSQESGADSLAEIWLKDHSANIPHLLNRAVGREFPELVDFPSIIGDVASIGSLFWNRRHPKVIQLVEALLGLASRSRHGSLPARIDEDFQAYSYPHSFVGHLVVSRISGVEMAIERFDRLVALAKDVGLSPGAQPLDESDFLPGTVASYRNPYHYDFSTWNEESSEVGKPLG